MPVLLLSALSSSPGGESGFDGLARGFRHAVPALTRALTEELRVLSRLAEPQTVLGFLNMAYLDTVARELASLMERECEAALRDNTTLSGKIKKYSARSRATVGKWLSVDIYSFHLIAILFVLLILSSLLKSLVSGWMYLKADCSSLPALLSAPHTSYRYPIKANDFLSPSSPFFTFLLLSSCIVWCSEPQPRPL